MLETLKTSFPALSINPRVRISRSALVTDDRFYSFYLSQVSRYTVHSHYPRDKELTLGYQDLQLKNYSKCVQTLFK